MKGLWIITYYEFQGEKLKVCGIPTEDVKTPIELPSNFIHSITFEQIEDEEE